MERCRSRQLLGNLYSPASDCNFFFPGLDLSGIFICEADLLVEISLDELEIIPAGLEDDFVKFRDRCDRVQPLEQPPQSDQLHIDN